MDRDFLGLDRGTGTRCVLRGRTTSIDLVPTTGWVFFLPQRSSDWSVSTLGRPPRATCRCGLGRLFLPPFPLGRGFPGPYTVSLVLRNERRPFDRCPRHRSVPIHRWYRGVRCGFVRLVLERFSTRAPQIPHLSSRKADHAFDPPYHDFRADGQQNLPPDLPPSLLPLGWGCGWFRSFSPPLLPSRFAPDCVPPPTTTKGSEGGGLSFSRGECVRLELGRGVPV